MTISAMAAYLDLVAHRAILFYRWGLEMWIPIIDRTNAGNFALDVVRSVGLLGSGLAGVPIGIYTE